MAKTYEHFSDYLASKKIHAAAYQAARPADYAKYEALYVQMGTLSFDHQAKFLINDWRLAYPLPKS